MVKDERPLILELEKKIFSVLESIRQMVSKIISFH